MQERLQENTSWKHQEAAAEHVEPLLRSWAALVPPAACNLVAASEQQPKSPAQQQAKGFSPVSSADGCSHRNSACLWFLWGVEGTRRIDWEPVPRNHKELISGHHGQSTQSTVFGGQTEKLFRAISPTNKNYANGWMNRGTYRALCTKESATNCQSPQDQVAFKETQHEAIK